ncbi:MAG: Sugar-specific transcriptional regulator TrmB [Methanocella sp. PtaU1.Bin125]|nr:MAG: Sugar-specific transcriptional regulator TrmB [Methanocella sp. PtaU1.Bin125]
MANKNGYDGQLTMSAISSTLIESLKTLGLTEYEAKVYSGLVGFGQAEAKQIYEYLEIPKPSVYQSLKTLTDKGLVQIVSSRPAIYRATPPKIALRHMTDVHRKAEDDAMLELEELEKSGPGQEYPNVLWTLFGQENVEHKLEEMLEGAGRSVRAILPGDYIVYLGLVVGRGFPIDVLTYGQENVSLIKDAFPEVHVHDLQTVDIRGLEPIAAKFAHLPLTPGAFKRALGVLADDNEMMWIPPVPDTVMTGLTSKNPMVVALMSIIFSTVWERTT